MLFIAYIVIAIAALVMVYFGHLQGTSQFYTSILGATIVLYCVYLDFKKRREKKAEEKRVKRADFLFELFKALAVAGVTLLVEHIGDIWAFLHK